VSDAQPPTPPGRPTTPRHTPLAEVAGWLGLSVADGDVEVTGISLSTQRIQPGDVYAALPGTRAHGATYAAAAGSAGAVAVLTDAEGATLAADCGVPLLVVDDARAVLGDLSAKIYGEPARNLRLIAVTGTQGKTTTTRLAELGARAGRRRRRRDRHGRHPDRGEDIKTALTTPEAPDLHGSSR
jgi:UDP-N-acetylmuramoyl-L-alanyl-D-glutamate--2,6-diaminopimelate ligase